MAIFCGGYDRDGWHGHCGASMNYVRELVRSSEYRQIPDLSPVRHVLYQGRWLRVDGWRKPKEGASWWLTPALLGAFIALLVCRFWL